MFEIITIPYRAAREAIGTFLDQLPDVAALLAEESIEAATSNPPFIQLGYDELPGEEIDRLLGYADIPVASLAIGLPVQNAVSIGQHPDKLVIYPFDGLEAHLRQEAPEITEQYDASGGMDNFVERRGESMTACEYLVGGVLECIVHCKRMRRALDVRW